MAAPFEVEVILSSAKDLKNVNWRHGSLKPYAVVWVDPKNKCSTKVDQYGDTCPDWDETLVIPFPGPIEDSTLYIDVVHSGAAEGTKPLIGSARLYLGEVVDDVGVGERVQRSLQLKRPSGRPQGKVDVKVSVRRPSYRAPDPYYAPPYGVPPPQTSRDYHAPPPYGNPYAQPPAPQNPYYSAAPPVGYEYGAYNAPQYGQQPAYVQGSYGQPEYKEEKKSKYGMGTGLAGGLAAGALGGLAIAEGLDYVEDKIADDVAEKVEDDLAEEKVEDDLGYDDDDGDY
ncbi:hypothetical protein L1049_019330 [Liquidambar formosana]|uniref:C2 domain-containing protein n=1 Tax=Liquidambar formosana TaxID=63359 RepID=A0AAP0X2Z7_LIQFO